MNDFIVRCGDRPRFEWSANLAILKSVAHLLPELGPEPGRVKLGEDVAQQSSRVQVTGSLAGLLQVLLVVILGLVKR